MCIRDRIDADAQGSLTASLGFQEPDKLDVSLATVMANIINEEDMEPDYGILKHCEGVDLMPGNIELARLSESRSARQPISVSYTHLNQWIFAKRIIPGMEKRLQRQSLRLRSLLGRPHLSRFRSWDLNPANFRVVFGSLQVFWNSKLAGYAFCR